MSEVFDAVVVGAGMAGASLAFELAASRRVLVVEREGQPGYHATGRSAALFSETYGNAAVRALTVGSRPFFAAPPAGFAEAPLWRSRGVLLVARPDQAEKARRLAEESRRLVPSVALVEGAAARRRVPALRDGYAALAVDEPEAMELDVHAIHQGFLRGLRRRGGRLVADAEVRALGRDGTGWRVETRAGIFVAPVVVNAAGAWADEVAQLAGLPPLGLTPLRRTIVTFDPPPGLAVDGWPMVVDVDERFYFKPEAGRLLASPADETPSPPCDAQPDEMDIAVAVDRVEAATTLKVARIVAKWAGLRTFAPDRTPVVGFDPGAPGFFWLAGQGGFGIQTAPALARLAAALVEGRDVPADLAALGLGVATLDPRRLRCG